MLKTRVITALVLVAVFAATWFFSPAVFKALIAAAFMIAMGEWLLMLKVTPGAAGAAAVIGTVVLAACAFYDIRLTDTVYTGLMLVVSCLWLALTAVLFAARNLGFRIKRTVSLVFAVLFPVSAWFAFERMTATGLVFISRLFGLRTSAPISAAGSLASARWRPQSARGRPGRGLSEPLSLCLPLRSLPPRPCRTT